jgi:menaquinone-dependent protoporphyrinogen oxidase
VAEAISNTLRECGAQVDVLPMQNVKDLSSYRAVIAGSAIRKSKWLPEAVQFVRTHQETLRHKSFAMFTVCITLAMSNSEQYRSAVAGWVTPVRSLVRPLSEGLFAGRLDFTRLPLNWDTLMLRATVAAGIFPRGDHRDWNAIRVWAENLKPVLGI